MSDFTVNWLWPQWVMVALLFMTLILKAYLHGKPSVQNGFYAMLDAAILIFVLICGGFFK